ncbi:helix-turn-helix transcriptional regulator [Agrobacterium tumefaciens]|uniref:helix-turn-helix transcriptional regulator n=1 Tax=Agrobacterium tumefaciens TaxID=358 RepID=UPI0021D22737|nr:AlpA family phage regulatory protein [Agrobacterium tumefaciens]UXT96545.1 AlpA family phage regulatory protein [Agrobacterium tumefaciens]
MTIPANDNKPRLMSPKEAAAATTLSRVLLAHMSKENRFPQPLQLTKKRIAYVRAEVEAWIDAAVGARVSA